MGDPSRIEAAGEAEDHHPIPMSTKELITFEPQDYLDSEAMIVEYLALALDSGDTALFLSAMSDVF